jgi:hypothetical protein
VIAAAGLAHVRRLPGAALALALACVAVALLWKVGFGVSVVPLARERSVGAVELVGALLAISLPVLTAPEFDGRERLGGRAPQWAHTATSLGLLLAPLVLLPVWRATVRLHQPEANVPAMTLLVGNLVLVSASATIAVLTLGRAIGTLGTVLGCAGLVTAQQAWPEGFLATHFSVGYAWRTDWFLTAILLGLTAVIVHATRAVPRDLR